MSVTGITMPGVPRLYKSLLVKAAAHVLCDVFSDSRCQCRPLDRPPRALGGPGPEKPARVTEQAMTATSRRAIASIYPEPDSKLLNLEREYERLTPLVAAAARLVEEADARFKASQEAATLWSVICSRQLAATSAEAQRFFEIERETGRADAIKAQREIESQQDKVAIAIAAAAPATTIAGMRVKAKALAYWLDLAPHLPTGAGIAEAIVSGEEIDDVLQERAYRLLLEMTNTVLESPLEAS